jgi:hypothetical protein
VANQNITLSLPEDDLQAARILAVQRRTSVSKLVAALLRNFVERETGYGAARDSALAMLAAGLDLGTGGQVRWNRDDLHER